jgi:hypothetical protein
MKIPPSRRRFFLGEILKLPKRKQEELAELLRDVSLSAIVSAAKIVADRLKCLSFAINRSASDPRCAARLNCKKFTAG